MNDMGDELDVLHRAYKALLHTPEAEGYQAWTLAQKLLDVALRQRDQVAELRSALEAIANADCTISMVGGCVGPTLTVRKRRGDEFVPVEKVNCAKHYALDALAHLAVSASALTPGRLGRLVS